MNIDAIDRLSLIIPIQEPTKKSYTINVIETGTDMIFVRVGFFSQRETVTKVDAAMGKIFMGELNVRIPNAQFSAINKIGQIKTCAHFFFSLCIKTSSRKIPTKLGTMPP